MSRATRKLATIQAKEELRRIKDEKRQIKHKIKEEQPNSIKFVKFMILISLILLVPIILLYGSRTNEGKTTYSASVTSNNVIDPATLRLSISVTNTGSSNGKPDCTVRAQNVSGSYSGWDMPILDREIKAGDTDSFDMNLTITNQGAAYITEANVSCT